VAICDGLAMGCGSKAGSDWLFAGCGVARNKQAATAISRGAQPLKIEVKLVSQASLHNVGVTTAS